MTARKRSVGGAVVESFGDEFPDLIQDRQDLNDVITLRLNRGDMERLRVFVDAYPSTLRGYVFARRIVSEINRALKVSNADR